MLSNTARRNVLDTSLPSLPHLLTVTGDGSSLSLQACTEAVCLLCISCIAVSDLCISTPRPFNRTSDNSQRSPTSARSRATKIVVYYPESSKLRRTESWRAPIRPDNRPTSTSTNPRRTTSQQMSATDFFALFNSFKMETAVTSASLASLRSNAPQPV